MTAETEERLSEALCRSVACLSSVAIDTLVVGGLALSYHLRGEAVVDHDVDLFIREENVDAAIVALSRDGFEVVRTHPEWLFKARLEGATVDVLYRLGRILELDEEMLARASDVNVNGCSVPIVSREDLAIGQAGAGRATVPGHWFEAIDLLRDVEIDWPYLARRGSVAADRTIALLHFARSEKIDVPDEAFLALSIPR